MDSGWAVATALYVIGGYSHFVHLWSIVRGSPGIKDGPGLVAFIVAMSLIWPLHALSAAVRSVGE